MGLTIGYHFQFTGTKEALVAKLQGVRDKFRNLPVGPVKEIKELARASMERGADFWEYSLGIAMFLGYYPQAEPPMEKIGIHKDETDGMTALSITPKLVRDRSAGLDAPVDQWDARLARINKSGNGIYFTADIGEGCEPFVVLLGRLGKSKVWRGMGTTKTQYAVPFLESHLTVIAMLDICKEAGILDRVNDDGGYWETRDLKVLADKINTSTNMIKAVSGALKKQGRKKKMVMIHSAIDKCANYMRVKEDPKGNK